MTDVPNHVSESLNRAHSRLDKHEGRIHQLELNEAGMAEWRLTATAKLDGIQSGITWVLRLVLGGLITGILTFIIAGGLNGTAQ